MVTLTATWRRWPLRIYAVILICIGLALALPGVKLIWLGGSFYYLLSGLATIIAGVLLFRGDWRGAALYGLMLIATVI